MTQKNQTEMQQQDLVNLSIKKTEIMALKKLLTIQKKVANLFFNMEIGVKLDKEEFLNVIDELQVNYRSSSEIVEKITNF